MRLLDTNGATVRHELVKKLGRRVAVAGADVDGVVRGPTQRSKARRAMKIRLAKISLASVLLASILGMVGTESAGAATVVRYVAYPYNLSSYVYPATPQFTCGDYDGFPVFGVNSFELHAPTGLGEVTPLITVTPYRWVNGYGYFQGENSDTPNQVLVNEIYMNPGTWRWTSSGKWFAIATGTSNTTAGHGWYFIQIEVQWLPAPGGVANYNSNATLDKDYIVPTAATDYYDYSGYSYSHYVIKGYQVCYM
jgi:hypothetical protein